MRLTSRIYNVPGLGIETQARKRGFPAPPYKYYLLQTIKFERLCFSQQSLFLCKHRKRNEEYLKYHELLSKEMKNTLKKLGYDEPTPIQRKTLELILNGWDILGIAQTGTGKTAAFAVPIIENLNVENKKVQTLVLCPTRELALQTTEVFRKLSAHKKIRTVSVYGGQQASVQIRALRAGAQVVVGTPGRVKDLIGRNVLSLKNVRTIVLDEADEMLDYGFLPDMKSILSNVTEKHQTLLFSATMSKGVSAVARQFQDEPVRIEIGERNQPTNMVRQSYLTAGERQKTRSIQNVIRQDNPRLTLVFCNTKRKVKNLQRQLMEQGTSACCLHGDMSQNQRDRIMNAFRKEKATVLVATDVAARGIDVRNIDLVINYDIPDKMEYYVHRIGRTGRAGDEGHALTLVNPRDWGKLADIERHFRIKIADETAVYSC
jgi:ATP-dependent RNA helicase DeaD